MISIKSTLKHLTLSFLFISVLFSCIEQSGMGEAGVLKGKITIGPLCPVETIPPQPGCTPTLETYKTWATAIWNLNKKTKVASLNPNLDGNYLISLPSGSYIIDYDSTQGYHGGSNLPSEITLQPKDTVVFNVSIDTGIR